jgi:hypothetical protein
MADERNANRTRTLAELMQTNTILHSIRLSVEERDEDIYTESIQPRLEANLYRPRVLAIKKEADERAIPPKYTGSGFVVCEKQSQPRLDVSFGFWGRVCSFGGTGGYT